MSRKWIALGMLVLIFIAAIVILQRSTLPRSKINRDNFDRISVGMNRQEVEKLLGGGPRAEDDGPYVGLTYGDRWMSPEGTIVIVFGNGVLKKEWIDTPKYPPTWLDRVKAFLRL